MKRLTILSLAVLVGMAMLGPVATDGQAARVLLIVPEDSSADLEYMLTKEAGVMTGLLEQAGFEVVVASASGQPFVAGEASLTPNAKFADVEVADYAGIIMPCMATVGERALPPELAAILQEAVAQGKPVAAQFGGINTLAQAGVLSGKRVSYIEDYVEGNPVFEDAVHSGSHGIVQDGNIITSGVCPHIARERGLEDGTTELTKALIAELKGDG